MAAWQQCCQGCSVSQGKPDPWRVWGTHAAMRGTALYPIAHTWEPDMLCQFWVLNMIYFVCNWNVVGDIQDQTNNSTWQHSLSKWVSIEILIWETQFLIPYYFQLLCSSFTQPINAQHKIVSALQFCYNAANYLQKTLNSVIFHPIWTAFCEFKAWSILYPTSMVLYEIICHNGPCYNETLP